MCYPQESNPRPLVLQLWKVNVIVLFYDNFLLTSKKVLSWTSIACCTDLSYILSKAWNVSSAAGEPPRTWWKIVGLSMTNWEISNSASAKSLSAGLPVCSARNTKYACSRSGTISTWQHCLSAKQHIGLTVSKWGNLGRLTSSHFNEFFNMLAEVLSGKDISSTIVNIETSSEKLTTERWSSFDVVLCERTNSRPFAA